MRLKLVKQIHKDTLRYWWIVEYQIIIAKVNLRGPVKLQDWRNYMTRYHACHPFMYNKYSYIYLHVCRKSKLGCRIYILQLHQKSDEKWEVLVVQEFRTSRLGRNQRIISNESQSRLRYYFKYGDRNGITMV